MRTKLVQDRSEPVLQNDQGKKHREFFGGMGVLAERPVAEEVLYFISAKAPNFPVKIGKSNSISLPRRMSQLQTALPYSLEVLFVGSAPASAEREVHDHLGRHWLRGEWFERSAEVMQWVDDLNEADPTWRVRFPIGGVRA